jgi:microcystin-dependent protein
MSTPFIGQIAVFAGNFAPRGWALCNGQLLSIAQNTALFSILGTTYGGNGTTTFALPDLQGRAALHFGQGAGLSNYVEGEVLGTESVSLVGNQVPLHTHNVMAAATGTTPTPGTGAVLGTSAATTSAYVPLPNSTGATNLAPSSITPAGSSLPHENRQPFLALSYMIALDGIFPSRN